MKENSIIKSLKFCFNDEIKKIKINVGDLEKTKTRIKTIYEIPLDNDIELKYLDKECLKVIQTSIELLDASSVAKCIFIEKLNVIKMKSFEEKKDILCESIILDEKPFKNQLIAESNDNQLPQEIKKENCDSDLELSFTEIISKTLDEESENQIETSDKMSQVNFGKSYFKNYESQTVPLSIQFSPIEERALLLIENYLNDLDYTILANFQKNILDLYYKTKLLDNQIFCTRICHLLIKVLNKQKENYIKSNPFEDSLALKKSASLAETLEEINQLKELKESKESKEIKENTLKTPGQP